MHYRNASPRLCGLNVGLKVQRGVEIAAGVPIASALDSVHADRHRAVLVRLHRLEGVRKPALRLAAFARPALKLATYLQQERTRMAWHSIYVAKGGWGAWGWGAKPGGSSGKQLDEAIKTLCVWWTLFSICLWLCACLCVSCGACRRNITVIIIIITTIIIIIITCAQ